MMAMRMNPWVLAAALGATALGCGGDDEEGTTASSTVASTMSSGSGSESGTQESSSGTPGSEASTAPADTSTTMDPSAGSTDTTTGADDGRCMPDNAPFMIAGTGFPQASIVFDFSVPSCSVKGLSGTNPQIIVDVKDSGLLNATAFGLEITDSSPEGLDFADPPMGDSQVIDFGPDVNMTFEATTIPDGVPVIIEFRVDSAGPALRNVSAVFG
ncbi:MAG TPA: hypothetical protein VG755_00700 [Nannocystaceae bacterium]|nr:hypothetical protein [Nannocystaceae bacterium]